MRNWACLLCCIFPKNTLALNSISNAGKRIFFNVLYEFSHLRVQRRNLKWSLYLGGVDLPVRLLPSGSSQVSVQTPHPVLGFTSAAFKDTVSREWYFIPVMEFWAVLFVRVRQFLNSLFLWYSSVNIFATFFDLHLNNIKIDTETLFIVLLSACAVEAIFCCPTENSRHLEA